MALSSPHPTDPILRSYGLGKLDDGMAGVVDQHLSECPDCRRQVAAVSADSFLNRVRGGRDQGPTVTHVPFEPGWTQGIKAAPTAPPPPADTLPPGLADHPDYQILRELGRGGMGVVYLAHNSLMGRDEVLKVMSRHLVAKPGVLDRFLREIRAVARLRHPNIVAAYSAIRLGESIVFAMEYVPGYDLASLIKAKDPLPVANACFFAYQAALGLQHAHEAGLVHRDIKPANLMLSRDGNKTTVKILDFGLAKAGLEEGFDGGLTAVGQALGTPDYIAPEQITDAPSADIRADIYSLGGTLFHLLTKRPPFPSKTLYDVYQAHLSRDLDPLNLIRPEVPAELAALVTKMMAKERSRRFQTPREVAEALTPFFRKAAPIALVRRPETRPAPQPNPVPIPNPVPPPPAITHEVAEDAEPKSVWESLIQVPIPDRLVAPAPPRVSFRPPRWVYPAVGVGVLLIAIITAWLGGTTRVRTPSGTIVLENVPENADILVDGKKITATWPGLGQPIEIQALAGPHKLAVKKDGFQTFGEEVTIEAGQAAPIRISLQPLPTDLTTPETPQVTPTDGGGPNQSTHRLGQAIEIQALDGQHQIAVKKEGFQTVGESVTVDDSKAAPIKVILQPLPPAQPEPQSSQVSQTDIKTSEATTQKRMRKEARVPQKKLDALPRSEASANRPNDLLQAGSRWVGTRTWIPGGVATFEMTVRSRQGDQFQGEILSGGRSRFNIAGVFRRGEVEWTLFNPPTPGPRHTYWGTLNGTTLNLTFSGLKDNGEPVHGTAQIALER